MKRILKALCILSMHSIYAANTANSDIGLMIGVKIMTLSVLLLVVLGLWYAVKKNNFTFNKTNGSIKILSTFHIGVKEKILIIQAEDVKLLIGVTNNNIQTLHQFTEAGQNTKYFSHLINQSSLAEQEQP